MLITKPKQDNLPSQKGIRNYFVIQKERFNAMGIDPTSMKQTIFNPLLLWIPLLTVIMLDIFMLISAWEHRNNMDLMTDILCPFFQSFLSVIKILCFLWNKRKIVKLVKHIWMWNLEAAKGDELKVIIDENKKDRFYSIMFCRWVFLTAIMALISPLLVACVYYLKGKGFMDSLELPFKAAYHIVVNEKSITGYLLAYLWNMFVVYCMFNGAISNDTLFFWFAHNVSAQFRILKLRFKMAAKINTLQYNEEKLLMALKSVIQYHYRVIDLAHEFDDVFKVTVFFKYTISYLEIACLVFQISRGGELFTVIFHISFLISASLQLMLYCQGGQRIIDESTSFTTAIYIYFPWHKICTKVRKFLLMPMLRSQKPCILTGVFFVANLQQFVWVFKTSGSFFTMLMSMDSKGKST